MKTGIIYKATAPNGKGYVGQTQKTLEDRVWHHFSPATNCRVFKRALDKYGDKVKWEVLRECPIPCLDAWEQIEILRHKTLVPNGYNLSTGGAGGMSGVKHTAETRKKIGDAQRGEKNHNYGKKHSPETRAKMSESRRGEKNWAYGKTFSLEYRKKLSDAQKAYNRRKNYNPNQLTLEFDE